MHITNLLLHVYNPEVYF